jgi:hypothetical protein
MTVHYFEEMNYGMFEQVFPGGWNIAAEVMGEDPEVETEEMAASEAVYSMSGMALMGLLSNAAQSPGIWGK